VVGTLHIPTSVMDDFSEIERVVGDIGLDDEDAAYNYEGATEISGANLLSILQKRVESLTSENIELNRRLSMVEAKTTAMYAEFVKPKERSRVEFPNENTIRDKYVRPVMNLDDMPPARRDSDSYVDVDGSASVTSAPSSSTQVSRRRFRVDHHRDTGGAYASPSPSPRIQHNPFTMFAAATESGGSMFKSNSAVAPQGYVRKMDVWGTALASFLTGAMRYYISKKNAGMIMIDEAKMGSVYSKLVSVLYESFMTKPLPSVSSPLTLRLSQAMTRTTKTDVPESTAEAWAELERTQEGKDIMVIIKLMISSAKRVPEAMVHPVSQLIPYMHKEPIQIVNGTPVFAIDSQVEIVSQPNPWESWCMILKDQALVKHVKYRISDMTPSETITRMTSDMRMQDLAEKKNWGKITQYNPVMTAG